MRGTSGWKSPRANEKLPQSQLPSGLLTNRIFKPTGWGHVICIRKVAIEVRAVCVCVLKFVRVFLAMGWRLSCSVVVADMGGCAFLDGGGRNHWNNCFNQPPTLRLFGMHFKELNFLNSKLNLISFNYNSHASPRAIVWDNVKTWGGKKYPLNGLNVIFLQPWPHYICLFTACTVHTIIKLLLFSIPIAFSTVRRWIKNNWNAGKLEYLNVSRISWLMSWEPF